MDTSFFSIIDIMITACGAYVIYNYILMIQTKTIRPNMLLPKDLDVKKCKDTEGYIRYIGIRQLIFGIVSTLCGVVGLYQDYVGTVPVIPYFAVMALFVVCTVVFCVGMSKAVKRFW